MRFKSFILIAVLAFVSCSSLQGQPDLTPPETPVLKLVSVNYLTGSVTINWSKSESPDASGYVVYVYKNGGSFALDTIFDPDVLSYLKTGPASGYFSESFVVASIDTAGNISPLSNQLNTIFTESRADTCNNEMLVSWNKYTGNPYQVEAYEIWQSVNNSPYEKKATVSPETSAFSSRDFQNGSGYCFYVKAVLSGGFESTSNKSCALADMQKAPGWINVRSIETTGGGIIRLSFTPDPSTELRNYVIERRNGFAGPFDEKGSVTGSGTMNFSDTNADSTYLYTYRIAAVNNCGNKVVWSNQASNIVLNMLPDGNDKVQLKWNRFRQWAGTPDETIITVGTGKENLATLTVASGDTSLMVRISDYMYLTNTGSICFRALLIESDNPYGTNGTASSNTSCHELTELINVPNVFTPDGNLINDNFKPVLSFTPSEYELSISDISRRLVFKTSDPLESWDGSLNGNTLPEGVYLWVLKVVTSKGKVLTKSGSVTLMINR